MTRPSLEDLAKGDRQLARFIEKANQKSAERAKRKQLRSGSEKNYESNHLPKTRDLDEDAAEAINRCILP